MKRTTKFIPIPTNEQLTEIKRLNNLFYENDHELLRGKRIKKKDRDSLEHLYYEFFKNVNNYDWSRSLLDMELDNLKSDYICGKNSNKASWSISIILGWLDQLPSEADEQFFYNTLSSRESYQRVVRFAYWN